MTQAGSVGLVERKYFTFARLNRCGGRGETLARLSCLRDLRQLNEDRSNAILILHALSATPMRRLSFPEEPQNRLVGRLYRAGQAFDTNKYFVICSNVIGGCQVQPGRVRSTRRPASLTP